MELGDFYKQLSFGSLSNLAIGGSGQGMVPFQKQDQILHYANVGVKLLYQRFPIMVKELTLRTYDEIGIYDLSVEYADTDPTVVDQKYIADSVDQPFEGDILQITGVFTETGCPLPINRRFERDSVFLLEAAKIQVPHPKTGDALNIVYRAVPIVLEDPRDETAVIELPTILEPVLEHYVAARVLGSMNGESYTAKSQEHMMLYEDMCQRIEAKDTLLTSQLDEISKLHARGFV